VEVDGRATLPVARDEPEVTGQRGKISNETLEEWNRKTGAKSLGAFFLAIHTPGADGDRERESV
jgi:hypothetical protein